MSGKLDGKCLGATSPATMTLSRKLGFWLEEHPCIICIVAALVAAIFTALSEGEVSAITTSWLASASFITATWLCLANQLKHYFDEWINDVAQPAMDMKDRFFIEKLEALQSRRGAILEEGLDLL